MTPSEWALADILAHVLRDAMTSDRTRVRATMGRPGAAQTAPAMPSADVTGAEKWESTP